MVVLNSFDSHFLNCSDTNSSLELTKGSATYSFSSTSSGTHVITATYSGDAIFAASSGSVVVTVGSANTSSGGTFTITAANLSVTQGNSGASTVTLTSKNSYSGTVSFTVSSDNTSVNDYGCYDVNDLTTAANGTATTKLTVYTAESSCTTTSSIKNANRHRFLKSSTKLSANNDLSPIKGKILPVSITLSIAGLALIGKRKQSYLLRKARGVLALIALASVAIGCGGSTKSTSTSTDVAKGSYTLSLEGSDTTDSSITASTTFTLTVN